MRKNSAAASPRLPQARARPDDALVVTDKLLTEYWNHLRQRGLCEKTVDVYQNRLAQLLDAGGGRLIERGTLQSAVERLLRDGYANQTVNMMLTAANGLLDYAGRRELQYVSRLTASADAPTLTRTEYLRLLGAAKALEKERTYLLVKTFATLGLDVQSLADFTVEAVRSGAYDGSPIPACLRNELLAYAEAQGVVSGAIFLTEDRQPMSRTYVTNSVKQLAAPARVDVAKCNPRCLKRLCQSTRDGIRANLALLLEQAHERLLEQEQLTIGWKAG